MSWQLSVWHEEVDDRVRLCIEAGAQVPDEVIASVAGSYWFEEVQYSGEDWEDDEDFGDESPDSPGGHLHG